MSDGHHCHTGARRWLEQGDHGTRWIVGHALRTLIKQGNAQALELLGFSSTQPPESVAFAITPQRVMQGESVTFVAEWRCRAAATLSIDYIVHHRRKNGSLSPKVFKLSRRRIEPNEAIRIEKSHSMRPITTRRYYPGMHRIEVLVNGQVICGGEFELLATEFL